MFQMECSAPNCLMRTFNYSKEQIKLSRSDYSVSFCSFPSDLEQRNAWIEAANDSNWKPARTAKLCTLHFRDDCFDQDGSLFDNAMPTIFFSNFRKHLEELVKNANLKMTFDSSDEDCKVVSDSDDAIPDEDDQNLVENVEISISDYEDYEIDECEEIVIAELDDTASSISPINKSPVKCPAKKTTKINKDATPVMEVKKKSPSDVVTQNSIQQRIYSLDDSIQKDNVTNGSSQVASRVDRLSVPSEKTPSFAEISSRACQSLNKNQVKPATNSLVQNFPTKSLMTSAVMVSIANSSFRNKHTVTKPVVSVLQPLGFKNTKPIMTSKISTAPYTNTSTPGTSLKKTTTSTPLMKTSTTNTKPFIMASPISDSRSSSFIISNPIAPKVVVNGRQSLGGTSITSTTPVMTSKPFMKARITNSPIKTSPTSLRNTLTNNLSTIMKTNASLQKRDMQVNSSNASPIGAQAGQGLVNLKLSTIGSGDAFQVAVPVQQLNLKPTLVQSVDASGTNTLRRVAAPVRYATVASKPSVFRTITVPNNLSVRNANEGSIISTQCSDNTPLQLVSSDSIKYLGEISPNHFTVRSQTLEPLTSKPTSIITNVILPSGSTISTSSPTISSQYVSQFLSKPVTNGTTLCFQSLPSKTNSTVAGREVPREQVFTRPSQSSSPPVFDVVDSPPVSVAPSLFNSYVSESPAKKRKIEEDENCRPESEQIVDPVAYVKRQKHEIDVLEKSILKAEREISTQKKKLQTLKKRYLAVKNPCDTKSDEQLVKEILTKYFEQDAVQFFVGQMKVSGKTYTQFRWSEEDKLFALGLLYRNPVEYHVLFEKFTLPSDKTLSKFVSKIKRAEQGVKKK